VIDRVAQGLYVPAGSFFVTCIQEGVYTRRGDCGDVGKFCRGADESKKPEAEAGHFHDVRLRCRIERVAGTEVTDTALFDEFA